MQTFKAKKEPHYVEAYKKHFSPIRDTHVRLLEIGVQHGGSLKMWHHYFSDAEVVGLDIDPACKEHEAEGITVVIGNQSDTDTLEKLGSFDIVIDDGGHTMVQQIDTFKTLFPLLKEKGIYVIEDLHTSYWREFGGGTGTKSTMEFLKTLLDEINEWALKQNRHSRACSFTNTYGIDSVHFYQSLVFIYKK